MRSQRTVDGSKRAQKQAPFPLVVTRRNGQVSRRDARDKDA